MGEFQCAGGCAGASVSIYTFMFMDAAGVSAMLDFHDCPDDPGARRHALALLAAAPHRGGVEFWAEGGQPMQVTADDLKVPD